MKKGLWKKIANVLTSVGAINWGLVALFDLNLITAILGNYPTGVSIVYGAVGVSGIITLLQIFGVVKK